MNTSLLKKSDEIKKIIKEIGIPIDDLNFMPGERQVELRYKNKTVGYLLCFDEENVMYYKGRDALTQKHLDWHFVYQHNKKEIDTKIFQKLKTTTLSIQPSTFRHLSIKDPLTGSPLLFECMFDGSYWTVERAG